MKRVLLMGSVFLPELVMDPLVTELATLGLAGVAVAPQHPRTADEAAREYVRTAQNSGATIAVAHSNAGNFVPAVIADSPSNA